MKFKLNYKIGCLIIVALLIIFLFRQYPISEGFDFSMPSISSSSDYGNIGPIPADTKWSDQTIADFKAKFKTVRGSDASQEELTQLQKYATEDEAKDFISNGEWNWPSYYTNCMKDSQKQNVIVDAVKAEKPVPTDEEIVQSADYKNFIKMLSYFKQVVPIRQLLDNPSTPFFSNCIGKLKESVFLKQLTYDRSYKLDDNKTLGCLYEFSNGKVVPNPAIFTTDATTNRMTNIKTSYDQFPSLVKGFSFKGPVDSCDLCGNIQSCPFSLNEDGSVSPFYNSYWGLSSSTLSMPKVSMPSVSMPSVSIPSVSMPSVSIPKVSMPTFSMPKF